MKSAKQKQTAQPVAPQNPYIRIGQPGQELKDARSKERAALESYSLLEKAFGYNPIVSVEEVTPEGQAYRFLAEGMIAVMELKSTSTKVFNLLSECASDLWNECCTRDQIGQARHWLAHVAEVQGGAYREQETTE